VKTITSVREIDVLADGMPDVTRNIGIASSPVDLNDNDAMAWLKALIWPEFGEHRTLFDAALQLARSSPPDIRVGDALTQVPAIIDELPDGRPVNIFHNQVSDQFSKEVAAGVDKILAQVSRDRAVNRIAIEDGISGENILTLTEYRNGSQQKTIEIADCANRGRSMT